MTVSDARLAQIAERFAQLEARLASGTLEGVEFVAASRDYAELRFSGGVMAKSAPMNRRTTDAEMMATDVLVRSASRPSPGGPST